ncbi:MAG: leucine-rich repeat domain-containing protein [Candidatus Hodarchaeota archaeon]
MTRMKAVYQGQRMLPEEKNALEALEKVLGNPIPSVGFINTFVFGFIAIDNHVSTLGIPNKGLVTLPELFGKLSFLEECMLFSNQLKTLPKSSGDLKSLKFLNLVNNKLNSLPESFMHLKSLQFLFLNRNKLEILPESFGRLTSLRRLNLRDNQLKTLPKSFLELPNLEMLWIQNNPLDDDAKKILKQLQEQGVNIDIVDPESEQVLTKIKEFIKAKNKN